MNILKYQENISKERKKYFFQNSGERRFAF